MNAYLIAAKANAWELDQHVGHTIDVKQHDHQIEAIGRGERFFKPDREKMIGNHRLFNQFFSAN